MRQNTLLAASIVVLALNAIPCAQAVTPTQNGSAVAKQRDEVARQGKAAAEAKARTDTAARESAAKIARGKARSIGNLAVHNELKRRLEAATAAAAVHDRILAADRQVAADHHTGSATDKSSGTTKPKVQVRKAAPAPKPVSAPTSG